MPANEFEKQVHQLMGDVRLSPSETVWPKVEERIREKKRRRGIFILLTLLLAGLGLLGYLSFTHLFPTNKPEQVKTNNWEHRETSVASSNNTEEKPNQSGINKKQGVSLQPRPLPASGTSIKPNAGVTKKTSRSMVRISAVASSSTAENSSVYLLRNNKGVKKGTVRAAGNNSTLLNEKVKDIHVPAHTGINNDVYVQKESRIKNDVIERKSDSGLIVADTLMADTSVVIARSRNDTANTSKPVVVKKKDTGKKVHVGFSFSTGSSTINERIFSFEKSLRVADQNAAPQGSTTYSNVSAAPSPSTSGFSFQAGVVVQKSFSRRSSVSVTPSYGYYSTHIKTGSRKDTIINIQSSLRTVQTLGTYYQARQQYNYTNKLHFIELPVQYQFQINKGTKTPLALEAGFVLSRLIATNALAYDTARGGVYYSSSDLYNKTQLSISTGLLLGINTKKGMQLMLGPQVHFGLTEVYKNELDKNKYLFYGGVHIKIMLPAK